MLLLQFPLAFSEVEEFPATSPKPDNSAGSNNSKSAVANIVFKSTDGGQTWQDISDGLPENMEENASFANESGLYLHAGNWIFHSQPNATGPFWRKEIFPDQHSSLAPGKNGVYAYNFWEGQFLKRKNATSIWWPMYTNFQEKKVRTVFESDGGTIFIGTDNGLFKSTKNGQAWNQVHSGAMNLVESNGVLMATSQEGIIRSTDGGENWELVISEGGVGISIEVIKDGFAAITYNSVLESRRVRTSYDNGKTWQPIDANLPPSLLTSSIVQSGDYLLCGHPNGIYKSADRGKTWELILPSINEKVFNLSVSGDVIYAMPRQGGC